MTASSRQPQYAIRASSIGPLASRVIACGILGRVKAVFEHSFYLQSKNDWICVGAIGLSDGPLNIRCDGRIPAISLGENFVSSSHALVIGDKLTIQIDGSNRWQPQSVINREKASLRRGIEALYMSLPFTIPDEGLAPLLFANAVKTRLVAKAAAPVQYLDDIVSQQKGLAIEVEVERIAPLVGLGPGLTPSGDDFLGGMLIALHVAGHAAVAKEIWSAIEPIARRRTNDISMAHLCAAAEGYGSAALHALLEDVSAGGSARISGSIADLVASGHTSGWDTLAGAIGALRGLIAMDAPLATSTHKAADRAFLISNFDMLF